MESSTNHALQLRCCLPMVLLNHCRLWKRGCKGGGHTLLGQETAETLSLLHVRPFPGKSVVSDHVEDDIRWTY